MPTHRTPHTDSGVPRFGKQRAIHTHNKKPENLNGAPKAFIGMQPSGWGVGSNPNKPPPQSTAEFAGERAEGPSLSEVPVLPTIDSVGVILQRPQKKGRSYGQAKSEASLLHDPPSPYPKLSKSRLCTLLCLGGQLGHIGEI